MFENHAVVVIQSLRYVQLFVTPWTAAHQAPLSYTISWSLLKFMSMEPVMLPNHLILCLPFLLFLLPSNFLSIRVFSHKPALHSRWPKYWSFSFSTSPSSEYSGLISFRVNWFDHLVVQGTHKSLLQHHNSKRSIPQHSVFFMVLLSHLFMTTGKYIALNIWTFVEQVMSLLFNILSRVVIAFLKGQVSFNFMAAVTVCSNFGVQENKICHCFHFFSLYLPWNDGTRCHDLHFLLSFKPVFSLFSFTLIKKLFSFSSLFAIKLVWSVHLSLLFLPAILISLCDSSSLSCRLMFSTSKSNK